jgi:hypothetical protein
MDQHRVDDMIESNTSSSTTLGLGGGVDYFYTGAVVGGDDALDELLKGLLDDLDNLDDLDDQHTNKTGKGEDVGIAFDDDHFKPVNESVSGSSEVKGAVVEHVFNNPFMVHRSVSNIEPTALLTATTIKGASETKKPVKSQNVKMMSYSEVVDFIKQHTQPFVKDAQ